jgi:hypothetical protein
MNTIFLLLAEFEESMIPAERIGEKYFGLKKVETYRRINEGKFPLPAFKLVESQKAPYLVNVADLAAYLDKMRDQEKKAMGWR